MGSRIKFPQTIGPQFVKKAMPWFETFWHQKERYPTPDEIIEHFGFSYDQVRYLNEAKYWRKSLKDRGIRFEESADLSDSQVAAIALLTNFSDKRSLESKLAQVGVSSEQLGGWYSDPVFKRELEIRTDKALNTSHAEIQASLIKAAAKGNVSAIKFYYEVTGKATTPETLNLKRALQITLEAIQTHVKDPELLAAIAMEIRAKQAIELSVIPPPVASPVGALGN